MSKEKKIKILKRAADMIEDGMYVHTGFGFPKLLSKYLRRDIQVDFITETGIVGAEPIDGTKDDYVLDGDLRHVKLKKGATYVKASDLFTILRTRCALSFARAIKVSENGDL